MSNYTIGKNPNSLKNLSQRKYFCNDKFFNDPNVLSSYWAGFIAADGYVMNTDRICRLGIMLSQRDKCHLERFKSDIDFTGLIHDAVIKPRGNGFSKEEYPVVWVAIFSREIVENLGRVYGIFPKKSLSLKPPSIDRINSLAYIKGYIDGDGSISSSGDLSILGTMEMCLWIKTTLCELSPHKGDGGIYPKGKIYRYNLTGRTAKVALYCLKDINTPLLERKWSNLDVEEAS